MAVESEPQRHRGAEEERDELTNAVIGAAIEVHRGLGPGLLESAYQACLCYELRQRGLRFADEVPLRVRYKEVELDVGYKLDIVVEDRLIVELKTVAKILPVHEAQLLTYLKMTGKPVGLLLNFYVPVLRHGIKRMVLTQGVVHPRIDDDIGDDLLEAMDELVD